MILVCMDSADWSRIVSNSPHLLLSRQDGYSSELLYPSNM
jgi:hypothetical protein